MNKEGPGPVSGIRAHTLVTNKPFEGRPIGPDAQFDRQVVGRSACHPKVPAVDPLDVVHVADGQEIPRIIRAAP